MAAPSNVKLVAVPTELVALVGCGTAKPLAFDAFESLPGEGAATPTTIAFGGAPVLLESRRNAFASATRCCCTPLLSILMLLPVAPLTALTAFTAPPLPPNVFTE